MRRIVCAFAVLVLALPAGAAADTYIGSATFVARDSAAGTLVDQGSVVCDGTGGGNSIGGACIPFSVGGNAISVTDDHASPPGDIAFQVCVDQDGNRQCGGSPTVAGCKDDVVFSHFDDASFSNPLDVPASGFKTGCPGGFPGWIVLVCDGEHRTGLDPPHAHTASTGTIAAVTQTPGSGPSGQFCNAPFEAGKPYRFAPPTENVCTVAGEARLGAPLNMVPRDSTYLFTGTTFDCDGPDFGGRYNVTANGGDTGVAGGSTCAEGHEKLVGALSATKVGAASTGSNTGPASMTGSVIHQRTAGFIHVTGTLGGGGTSGSWVGDLTANATWDENGPNPNANSKCTSLVAAIGIMRAQLNGTITIEPTG